MVIIHLSNDKNILSVYWNPKSTHKIGINIILYSAKFSRGLIFVDFVG